MSKQLQLRRGTAAAWVLANVILAEGELGVETDTGNWKTGDGVTAWNDLEYSNANLHNSFSDLQGGSSTERYHLSAEVAANVADLPDAADVFDKLSDTTDDIAEGTNKFTTQADITRLSNTSGTNTGDQDLSDYPTFLTDATGNYILMGSKKIPVSNVELSDTASDYQASGNTKPYLSFDNPSEDQMVDLEVTPITWINILGLDGKEVASAGTVSFDSVSSDKYYDALHSTIITGDGTSKTITNNTGDVADIAVYDLTWMGTLPTVLATKYSETNFADLTAAEVEEIAPDYVDSVQTVGYKFGDDSAEVVVNKGRNLFDDSIVRLRKENPWQNAYSNGVIKVVDGGIVAFFMSCKQNVSYSTYFNPEHLLDGIVSFGSANRIPDNYFDNDFTWRNQDLSVESGYKTLITTTADKFIFMSFYGKAGFASVNEYTVSNLQIEEGSTATEYQPPKDYSETLPEMWSMFGVSDTQDSKKFKRVKLVDAVQSDGSIDWSWTSETGNDCLIWNTQEDSTHFGENIVSTLGSTSDTGWDENDDVSVVFDNTGGEDNNTVETYSADTLIDTEELFVNSEPKLMIEHGANNLFSDYPLFLEFETTYNQFELENIIRDRNNKLIELETDENGTWGMTRNGDKIPLPDSIPENPVLRWKGYSLLNLVSELSLQKVQGKGYFNSFVNLLGKVGDFETDSNSDGLADSINVRLSTASFSLVESIFGGLAQKIENTGNTNWDNFNIALDVNIGDEYYISVFAYGNGILGLGNSNAQYNTYGGTFDLSEEWKKRSKVFSPTQETVYFLAGDGGTSGNYVVADKVQLVNLTEKGELPPNMQAEYGVTRWDLLSKSQLDELINYENTVTGYEDGFADITVTNSGDGFSDSVTIPYCYGDCGVYPEINWKTGEITNYWKIETGVTTGADGTFSVTDGDYKTGTILRVIDESSGDIETLQELDSSFLSDTVTVIYQTDTPYTVNVSDYKGLRLVPGTNNVSANHMFLDIQGTINQREIELMMTEVK